jgi:hypothetical protein
MPRAQLLSFAAGLVALLLAPTWAAAQVVSVQKVALTGEAAPGGGTFAAGWFSAPTIGPNGHVVFTALAGGLNGIYGWNGTTLSSIARDGQVIPGGSATDTFTLLNSYSLPVDANGRTAFGSYYASSVANQGVFTNVGGTLTTIAKNNPPTTAPGTGNQPFTGFDLVPKMNAAGQIAFGANYGNGRSGVFRHSGTLSDVVLENATAPGGGTFFGVSPLHGQSATGGVLFRAATTNGVSEGLFTRSAAGATAMIARSGGAVPGNAGLTFASSNTFESARINAADRVVFNALVADAATNTARGIFTNADGTLRALVRCDLPGNPGTAVPGVTGQTLFNVFYPEINAAGRVAFIGQYGVNGSLNGVFAADAGGPLLTVARPGMTGGGGTITQVDNIKAPAMNAGGQIAFTGTATFSGIDRSAAYLAEPDGALRLIARAGQLWDVDGTGGNPTTKTISQVLLADGYAVGGDGVALNDLSQVSLLLSFTDGTSGVYVVQMTPVPEPATVLAVVCGAGALLGGGRRLRRVWVS